MGYLRRYWKEAEEKKLPLYKRIRLVQLKGEDTALVYPAGYANIWEGFADEIRGYYPSYEEAFEKVEAFLKSIKLSA